MSKKYIFITGGVCSSLGKGLTGAAIGTLLEKKGYKIAFLKLDPYLNVDPGTMNPLQHGEVYVTEDGAETDLDLGHYFRFTNAKITQATNATSGQIYHTVIKQERRGDYMGKTVQVIPHITDEIKKRIRECTPKEDKIDIVLVEIGGTVGDIESLPFMEAIRQFQLEQEKNCINVHLTYVPFLKAAGEWKTKPSQHSVQVLRGIGLFPDIILCRCEEELPEDVKQKISLFCNVPLKHVIQEEDVKESIYEVPLKLHTQELDKKICELLSLKDKEIDLSDWQKILNTIRNPKGVITVGIVGKYLQHKDAYKSVFEALLHGALANGYQLKIKDFEADKLSLEDNFAKQIQGCDGYLVPGGFGERGWNGKILTAKYCRENKIPYFGICLGMQVMAVEAARNLAQLKEANSTEFDQTTPHPIISLLHEQKHIQDIGGTMRLGAYSCHLQKGTKAYASYQKDIIYERHRHRYEFNNEYQTVLKENNVIVSGFHEKGPLVEILENKDHPWMVGVQFHPEFSTKIMKPHPLFVSFIKAMIHHKNKS